MPLPYPEVCGRDFPSSGEVAALKSGVNGVVLILNFLHLGRPSTAPEILRLGNRLNSRQWNSVALLKSFLKNWVEADDVDPVSMGRSAAKVESIEAAISDLEARAKSLGVVIGANGYSGSQRSSGFSGSFCEDAGVTVGVTDHAAFSTFKEIESDRLAFVGVPCFDPSPFLDEQSRRVFQFPLDCSRDPSSFQGSIPHVKLHCPRSEKIRLFELLDRSKRLSLHTADQVRGSYTSGMFAVVKSLDRDRLILDSRPPNLLEIPMQRWIKSLASAESLSQICLGQNEHLVCSGNDVRDYYHMFTATEQRRRRNALAGPLHPAEVRHLSCYSSEFDRASKVYGALATLAMGDAQAVEIAQTCHLGMALQEGITSQSNLLNLAGFHPRSKDLVGIIIDDFIAMSVVDKEAPLPSASSLLASRMQDKYEKEGLIPHKEKGFRDETSASFWGIDVSGQDGLIRGSLRRAIPLFSLLLRVAKLGHCSVGLLEVLIGSVVSLFLLRRRFLSVIDFLYKSCRGRKDAEIVKLSGRTTSELLICAALVPVAVVNLRASQRPRVVATDASSWGEAAVVAPAPLEFVKELHRFALKKSVWTRLLSPSQAWLRAHGLLAPEEELPDEDEAFKMNPLWRVAAEFLEYKVLFSEKSETSRHINISEIRSFLRAERDLGRKWPSSREIAGMDSQVGLGCLIKGRSSSSAINSLLSRSIGHVVIFDSYSAFMYYQTSLNPADDPTRGVALRRPSLPMPSWWEELCRGNCLPFDEWLEQHGLGYIDMTGLPSFSELLGPYVPKHETEQPSSSTMPCESTFSDQADFSHSVDCCNEAFTGAGVSQCPSAPGPFGVSASLGSAEEDPATRECTDSVRSEVNLIHDKNHERTFHFTSRLKDLSEDETERLYKIFCSFDEEQIFRDSNEPWPPQAPGFLDLFSGERGVARQLRLISGKWVISFDIIYSPKQDLNDKELRSDIEFLLAIGAVLGVGLAPVCKLFSVAVTPPIRSRDWPMGIPGVSAKVQLSLDDGNQTSVWVISLLRMCRKFDIRFWLENPALSWLFRIPGFLKLIDEFEGYASFWTADYCRFGKKWRKRTKFFTDTVLQGHKTLCNGCLEHIKLRGRSRFHRKAWTVVAQPYPVGVCKALSFGLSISSGAIDSSRPFDPSSCAKVGNLRIGEAKNPGPARRESVVLEEVPLVEAKTASLQSRVWKKFGDWVKSNVGAEAAESLLSNPQLLCLLLKEYGNVLYAEGSALYIYRHLAVYVQKSVFGARNFMSIVWDNLHRWESLEPIVHRIPVPGSVLRAMITLSIHWGWRRFAGAIALSFFGITRPGEVLAATRRDLVLPEDLLMKSESSPAYLRIENSKSRRRGKHRVQHASVINAEIVIFLSKVFGHLSSGELLYPISGSSFRRRWDKLCNHLCTHKEHRLTPGSLRGGGALEEYRAGTDLHRILWRMRIRHLITLEHYVQEVAGESFFADLSHEGRRRICLLSELFKPTLAAFES